MGNIFASDLDQTLIYSSRWIEDLESKDVINIEKYNGREISYILSSTIEELKKITKKNYFIPITTRTLHQYNRIDFLDVPIEYAIVANGGIVLRNGEVDKCWEAIVLNELKKAESFESVRKKLENLLEIPEITKLGIAEDMFLYLITSPTFNNKNLLEYKDMFKGWTMYDQGKKVYFVPDVLQKGKALEYVIKKIKPDHVISAGDSLLDISMENKSDLFLVPGHSKLNSKNKFKENGIINGLLISKKVNEIFSYK